MTGKTRRETALEACLSELREQLAFMFADDLDDPDSMATAMLARIDQTVGDGALPGASS